MILMHFGFSNKEISDRLIIIKLTLHLVSNKLKLLHVELKRSFAS